LLSGQTKALSHRPGNGIMLSATQSVAVTPTHGSVKKQETAFSLAPYFQLLSPLKCAAE